jgi:hypothetical protein
MPMKWSEILAATPFPFDNQNWSRRKLSYFLKNAGTRKTGGGFLVVTLLLLLLGSILYKCSQANPKDLDIKIKVIGRRIHLIDAMQSRRIFVDESADLQFSSDSLSVIPFPETQVDAGWSIPNKKGVFYVLALNCGVEVHSDSGIRIIPKGSKAILRLGDNGIEVISSPVKKAE